MRSAPHLVSGSLTPGIFLQKLGFRTTTHRVSVHEFDYNSDVHHSEFADARPESSADTRSVNSV